MPDLRRHIFQAEKNERFFDQFDLDTTPFLDWAVTGLFYSALHYVDAFLAKQNVHPQTHEQRDWILARTRNISAIYAEYQELKDRSIDARYKVIKFRPQIVKDLKKNQFDKIKAHLRPLL